MKITDETTNKINTKSEIEILEFKLCNDNEESLFNNSGIDKINEEEISKNQISTNESDIIKKLLHQRIFDEESKPINQLINYTTQNKSGIFNPRIVETYFNKPVKIYSATIKLNTKIFNLYSNVFYDFSNNSSTNQVVRNKKKSLGLEVDSSAYGDTDILSNNTENLIKQYRSFGEDIGQTAFKASLHTCLGVINNTKFQMVNPNIALAVSPNDFSYYFTKLDKIVEFIESEIKKIRDNNEFDKKIMDKHQNNNQADNSLVNKINESEYFKLIKGKLRYVHNDKKPLLAAFIELESTGMIPKGRKKNEFSMDAVEKHLRNKIEIHWAWNTLKREYNSKTQKGEEWKTVFEILKEYLQTYKKLGN
jgi:hypothetical protein